MDIGISSSQKVALKPQFSLLSSYHENFEKGSIEFVLLPALRAVYAVYALIRRL